MAGSHVPCDDGSVKTSRWGNSSGKGALLPKEEEMVTSHLKLTHPGSSLHRPSFQSLIIKQTSGPEDLFML